MARKPKAEPTDAAPLFALVDQDAPAGTDLVVVEQDTPPPPEVQARRAAAIVLLQPERFDQFYERMKAETSAHVADVSTAAGRDAVRSLAFRVTKTKTTLDKAALELTEGWRRQTKAVNDARKPIVDRLAALADEVRAPLTAWEEAEAARVEANEATLTKIRNAATIAEDDTSATVANRGREIYGMTFDAPQWSEDEAAEAEGAKQATVQALLAARDRLKAKEAEAAELEQLRREKAEREERERVERVEREAAEAKVNYARAVIDHIRGVGLGMIGGQSYPYVILIRELEEKVETGEAAATVFGGMADEVERVRVETLAAVQEAQRASIEREREKAAQEAAEQARRDAEARAAEAQRQRDEQHARELREAQEERDRIAREAQERDDERRREDARREAAAQAERDAAEAERVRQAAEQRRRDQEAADAAEVERKRQANREHRATVQREVKEALMTCGLDEEQARKVVLAIVAGNVPHCTVSF